MVGISVQTNHNGNEEGIWLYTGDGCKYFLSKYDAAQISESVKEARVKYWKRFKLPHMVEQRRSSLSEKGTT